MDKYDYHFISIKFLTAILFALFFAFLINYVFLPETEPDREVYKLSRQEIKDASRQTVFSDLEKQKLFNNSSESDNFKYQMRQHSFKIMDEAKTALLAVVTANHLEDINEIIEAEMSVLNDFQRELEAEKEKKIQQKRQESEADLAEKLENIRQQINEEYSAVNQKEIRDNYLRIINLKIAVEVLAENAEEKEKYQAQLQEVQNEQQQLLSEKNSQINNEISAKTTNLIMEFNQNFASYRQQLNNEQQQLLNQRRKEIENKLDSYRKEIRAELNSAREAKKIELEELIAESKKYY